jgi:hypothetical protein
MAGDFRLIMNTLIVISILVKLIDAQRAVAFNDHLDMYSDEQQISNRIMLSMNKIHTFQMDDVTDLQPLVVDAYRAQVILGAR